MVCWGCVQKLASKLVSHHPKLNWIRALELAEKGVERVEQRRIIKTGDGIHDDYTQTCNNCGKFCDCSVGFPCDVAAECEYIGTCSGLSCCPSPLPNSHQVSNNCGNVYPSFACRCRNYFCAGRCTCHGSGSCGYDCDEGYEWDGEACKPVAPPGIVFNGKVVSGSAVLGDSSDVSGSIELD